MSWTKKRSPLLPAEPAFHHPDRCMNCGHLKEDHEHVDGVGCLVEGGTKYIENENGDGIHACSCDQFIPAPQSKEEQVTSETKK